MTDTESGAESMDLRLETLKSFSGKLLQAVLGFAGTIIFARVLGPVSFGGFYFLLRVIQIVDRPLRGVGQALRKRYSEADADQSQLFGGILLVNCFFFLVVAVLVWIGRGPLREAAGFHAAPSVFVALVVGEITFFMFQQMLGARGWIGKQTWNDTLRSVLTLGLQLAFVSAGLGAAGMGYGLAGASMLSVPVAWYYLRNRPVLPDRETLRSLWRYAKYSTPAAFVGKAYDAFDVLLIGAVLSTASVGYYEVALKLTIPAMFLPQVIGSGLMPKVSNKHSRDEPVGSDVSNTVAYVSLVSVPLVFGALALSERLVVTAYGADYRTAAPLLVGLAAYQFVRSQTIVHRQTLSGLDRPDLVFRVDAATLVLNVVLGTGLVLSIGVVGVVVATVIAESVRYILSASLVSRLIDNIMFVPRPLVEQIIAGGGMFMIVAGLKPFVPLPSFPYVAALVGAGGLTYGVLLVTISGAFRRTVVGALRDALGEERLSRIVPWY